MIVGLSLTGGSLPLPGRGGKLRGVSNSDVELLHAAVDGVVLAAGRSRRMGAPKPGLGVDDTTFIARVVNSLLNGGCRDVVAVVGTGAGDVGAAAAQAGARVVVNTAPESEQIDSLRLGLRNLMPGAGGALVLPVDHPLVQPRTVSAVIQAFARACPPIARATYAGAPGHPTLFAAALFDELLHGDLAEGARTLIAAHGAEVLDVPVDDPGITADIDTPDDYRRHVGGEPT